MASPESVHAAVSALVDELDMDDPSMVALASLALTLASTLDDGAGMATAAVARELRATLAEIRGGDDGDDDGGAFAAWEDQLSRPS